MGRGCQLYFVISGIEYNMEGEVQKARDTLKPPCVFNLSPLAPSTLYSQNAPKNNPTVFFPRLCWKWPNYCQEEECEAFPGAVRDVRAQRRPLRFRQPGYSRALGAQTPNSWSRLLLPAPAPKQSHPHPTPHHSVCEGLFFTSGAFAAFSCELRTWCWCSKSQK